MNFLMVGRKFNSKGKKFVTVSAGSGSYLKTVSGDNIEVKTCDFYETLFIDDFYGAESLINIVIHKYPMVKPHSGAGLFQYLFLDDNYSEEVTKDCIKAVFENPNEK
jgi:hypothetical protein